MHSRFHWEGEFMIGLHEVCPLGCEVLHHHRLNAFSQYHPYMYIYTYQIPAQPTRNAYSLRTVLLEWPWRRCSRISINIKSRRFGMENVCKKEGIFSSLVYLN